MANANTVAAASGLPGSAQGASSTAEFQFNDSAGTRAMVKVGPPLLKNKRFRVKAGGRVTGGTTTNFTAKLYYGTSATIGSNTNIATSGALAVNSTSGNWYLEAEIAHDETSDKLQGLLKGHVNATAVAQAILTNAPTGVTGDAEIGFTVTGQFSASDAGNAARCDFLEVEIL